MSYDLPLTRKFHLTDLVKLAFRFSGRTKPALIHRRRLLYKNAFSLYKISTSDNLILSLVPLIQM
jgi:hypothetical protein